MLDEKKKGGGKVGREKCNSRRSLRGVKGGGGGKTEHKLKRTRHELSNFNETKKEKIWSGS